MTVVLLLAIFGCTARKADILPLPQGIVRVHGVLSPADLSPVRRGSFLLSQEGRTLYYAESPTISLHRFVGCNCFFHGVVEPNSDPTALPVLVVREVEGGDAAAGMSAGSSSSSVSSVTSSSGSGVPCGGERGVLCSIGEYCVVESFGSTFGHCRSIKNGF